VWEIFLNEKVTILELPEPAGSLEHRLWIRPITPERIDGHDSATATASEIETKRDPVDFLSGTKVSSRDTQQISCPNSGAMRSLFSSFSHNLDDRLLTDPIQTTPSQSDPFARHARNVRSSQLLETIGEPMFKQIVIATLVLGSGFAASLSSRELWNTKGETGSSLGPESNPSPRGPDATVFSAQADPFAALQAQGKTLIELGWDAPTPNHLRAKIKTMEQRPFNGTMINLNAGKTIFNKTAYPQSAFVQDRADLAATKSKRLNQNYVTIWSAREAGWDWFDDQDWLATETNASNFAKTAKAGQVKGFMFDPEPYGTNPWSYTTTLYPTRSFAAVQAKVRARGAAFLNAIQAQMPSVKIVTLFNIAFVKWQATDRGSLEKADWALLAAFIDGMLDVINPKAQLIDGHELGYYLTDAKGFDAYKIQKQNARDFVAPENRTKYDRQVKVAHAVFADGVLNLLGSPRFFGFYLQNDLERMQLFEHNVFHGLRSSDEIVWVYNEQMDWWGSKGKGVKLPVGIEAAVNSAVQKIAQKQGLGFSIEASVARANLSYTTKVQVAGRITINGKGLGAVMIDAGFTLDGEDTACRYTDPDGYFFCVLPPNWSGKITPALTGYSFKPAVVEVKNLSKQVDDQNFEANQK
jgi:hypothetical protein